MLKSGQSELYGDCAVQGALTCGGPPGAGIQRAACGGEGYFERGYAVAPSTSKVV